MPPIIRNFHMCDCKPNQNRKSLRLPNYDYTQEGAYFITILTSNRECFFGDVVLNQIQLSQIGNIVKDVWQSIPIHFPQATVNHFVIMPNHIHGIITIVGARHEVSSLRRQAVPLPINKMLNNLENPHQGQSRPSSDPLNPR